MENMGLASRGFIYLFVWISSKVSIPQGGALRMHTVHSSLSLPLPLPLSLPLIGNRYHLPYLPE